MNAVPTMQGSRRRAGVIEWVAPGLCLAGLVALQWIAACRYRFNTDEPQHLHVIWGWMHGLVQYRDVFDNHPPLFHMLMAPLMGLFPERADIVAPMRLMMIPFHVAGLGAIFWMGRALYSARAGAWLALIGGALPWAFFPGAEFRPDNVYVAVLFWALALAVTGRMTRGRMAGMGLLLGICGCLTMKTALGVASMAFASVAALGLRCRLGRWRMPAGEAAERVVLWGAAGLAAPWVLCLYFARQGALPILYYCVLRHNVVPHAYRWGGSVLHYYYPLMALPALLGYAVWIFKQEAEPGRATRRVFVSLFAPCYLLLYFAYWPELTGEDQLPWVPLLPLAAMPLAAACRVPRRAAFAARYLLGPCAFLFCVWLILHERVMERGSIEKYVRPIATVLRLTQAGEDVMDVKGDAIYRPRPFYYGMETFTRVRMRMGWIRDDIVADLIATRTAVCFHPPFPGVTAGTNSFVKENYLPLETEPRVWVLGQKLGPGAPDGTGQLTISIPGEYLFLRKGEPATVQLDGQACSGPRTLEAGLHRYGTGAGEGSVTLFWARAWRLGYRPAN